MLPACKPGSVEPKLGRSFLWERGRPRPRAAYPQRLDRGGPPLAAYLALLPLGFAVPLVLPPARWALTPPFHPCLCAGEPGHRRSVLCCTFRRGKSPRPGVTWQRALWSPDFPRVLAHSRPSGRQHPQRKITYSIGDDEMTCPFYTGTVPACTHGRSIRALCLPHFTGGGSCLMKERPGTSFRRSRHCSPRKNDSVSMLLGRDVIAPCIGRRSTISFGI